MINYCWANGPVGNPVPACSSRSCYGENDPTLSRSCTLAETGERSYFLFFLRCSTSSWISGVQMTSSASSILPPGMTMVFGRDM